MKHVVFDIGAVLVDWQPHLAWMDAFESEDAVRDFMARTDFLAKNARADGGARFEFLADEIEDAEDRRLFREYVARYARTVPNQVPGTWEILDRLRNKGVPVHAITNWSAETWHEGLRVHPRLDEVFETLVISGREGVTKPNARIYEILCERAGVAPEACVFIDDGLHNVEGAQALGMDGIHFTVAGALEQALVKRGLL